MSAKKILKEKFDHLKKVFEKLLNAKQKKQQPQLVLQPYRTKNILPPNNH